MTTGPFWCILLNSKTFNSASHFEKKNETGQTEMPMNGKSLITWSVCYMVLNYFHQILYCL